MSFIIHPLALLNKQGNSVYMFTSTHPKISFFTAMFFISLLCLGCNQRITEQNIDQGDINILFGTEAALTNQLSATPTIQPQATKLVLVSSPTATMPLPTPTTLPTPTATRTPQPEMELSIDAWKIAIPVGDDKCKFKVFDSSNHVFEISQESETENSTFCRVAWSPEGDKLAISNGNHIDIVNLESDERIQLSNPVEEPLDIGEYSFVDAMSWSNDSQWLQVFIISSRNEVPIEVYQSVLFDTFTKQTLVLEENFRFLEWSRALRNEFAFISRQGNNLEPGSYQAGIWNISSSQPKVLVETFLDNHNLYNSRLIISPDSNWGIANAHDRNTGQSTTLLINLELGLVEVLNEQYNDLYPWSWSSSGKWISFYDSAGLHFQEFPLQENPSLNSFKATYANPLADTSVVPIGWSSSKDIFVFSQGSQVYLLDPSEINHPVLLVDIANLESGWEPFTAISFWQP